LKEVIVAKEANMEPISNSRRVLLSTMMVLPTLPGAPR
jgi:hypothetical protein